jgi:superoxide dismutase, Cu-Zn family
MRSGMMALTGACACLLASCGTPDPAPGEELRLEATMQGQAGFGHVTGAATAYGMPGGRIFTATVAIAGDQPDAVRPWHVHEGSCAGGGAIVGNAADYPMLNVGADGNGSSSADVASPLDAGGSYHVNVHASTTEMATIVACGELARQDTP